MTLGSELREAWEGLGGSWITRGGDTESGRGDDDEDLEDGGDPERLTPSLAVAIVRSLECRLPVGGFTNFEKKPGAITSTTAPCMVSVVHHSSSAFSVNSLVTGDV